MPQAWLADRAVLAVSGDDAREFLDRLATNAVDRIGDGEAGYGALLTPQGKIIADFICFAAPADGVPRYLLDTPRAVAADLAKRLTVYKLRAKVAVADGGDNVRVLAGWDTPAPAVPPGGAVATDPRLPALGWRAVVPTDATPTADVDERAYHAHRVAFGVPEGGRDFAFNDAFPHEALMDQTGGVAFDKGCYIGQEVVSRMQHRGTARTRVVPVAYEGIAPPSGTEVLAGERPLGRTGSVAGQTGLALLRLDRAADALAAGEPITAGGIPLRLAKPDWVRFAFPGDPPQPVA